MTDSYRPRAYRRKMPGFVKLLIGAAIVFIILLAFNLYIKDHYAVNNVYVEGNVHYTDEQIKEIVMDGKYGHNSFYLSLKYKNKEVEDVPFVETMDVKIESADTIRIIVYEKTLAGYVEYLGRYIYFDKDGIVVESSLMKTASIPQVIGVDFDYVVLYEKLPVENESLFQNVLDVTKLMTKYQVYADKLYFKDNGDIVLYKDQVIVALGSFDDLDFKIMNLPTFLKNIEGKKGTLRLEKYNENTENVFFEEASENSGEYDEDFEINIKFANEDVPADEEAKDEDNDPGSDETTNSQE